MFRNDGRESLIDPSDVFSFIATSIEFESALRLPFTSCLSWAGGDLSMELVTAFSLKYGVKFYLLRLKLSLSIG